MSRPSHKEARVRARRAYLTAEHVRILQRLVRLRAATSRQLHRLCDPLMGMDERAVRRRLERMEKHRLVKSGVLRPQRGAFSPLYYQLAYGGLVELGRGEDVQLTKRPPQHVLEYLIFRNEVYATARAAGWRLAAPVLVPEHDHASYLALYTSWAKRARLGHLEALRARKAHAGEMLMARLDHERVEKFAPTELSFDFIMRLGDDGTPIEVALLVVDDPRHSIRTQVGCLPAELQPGLRLVLRDHLTRYDLLAGKTYGVSRRLREWQAALAKRYTTLPFTGEALLAEADANPLFPDVWAVRTAAPKLQ